MGGASVGWPLAARAQQIERTRGIGVLMNRVTDDAEGQAGILALRQSLQQLGWGVRMDVRWSGNDPERTRKYATELVALTPDVILAAGTLGVTALQRVTRILPIVFVQVSDPVGTGLVDTLARPGGNTTGFMLLEFGSSGKWLEILKQIAPNITRAAVLRDSANPAATAEFGAIQAAAQSLGVEVRPVSIRDASEIEYAIATFAHSANGGLIVTPSAGVSVHQNLIITLAARHKLPAVYANRTNVVGGGLISYAPDRVEQFRRAAGYVDRILRGEKAADLPVQAPTKLELTINLRTAKALGLAVPPAVLARADEVIE